MTDSHKIMISGCSGGGKSTLLLELANRGYAVVAEPGRRIIAEEREGLGLALPWVDAAAFARRALSMSVADHQAAHGLTFFDRGVVDAAVAITASGGDTPRASLHRAAITACSSRRPGQRYTRTMRIAGTAWRRHCATMTACCAPIATQATIRSCCPAIRSLSGQTSF